MMAVVSEGAAGEVRGDHMSPQRHGVWATDRQTSGAGREEGRRGVGVSVTHRLVGLVVKASASRAEDPGIESRLRRDFSGSSHTSDFFFFFCVLGHARFSVR